MDMNLHQNGTVVTGTATLPLPPKKGDKILPFNVGGGSFGSTELRQISGEVDGSVKGNRFAVIIHWSNNTTGVYNGTIGPSGRIEGTGYNQASPSVKVNWYSETHMVCADAAPGAPVKEKSINEAADEWLEKKRREGAKPTSKGSPNQSRGFINGLQLGTPTPTPSAQAEDSSSNESDDRHGKHKKKKNKKHHHHHHDNDDQNQGSDND